MKKKSFVACCVLGGLSCAALSLALGGCTQVQVKDADKAVAVLCAAYEAGKVELPPGAEKYVDALCAVGSDAGVE